MTDESYFDSDEYQREIAAGYDERIATFSPQQVQGVFAALGFSDIDASSIQLATGGNIHATYVTPELAVKLNQDRAGANYFANKFISDRLGDSAPVVHVLAYDNFEQTGFGVLVMERAPGKLLQHDLFELDEEGQRELFQQILDVVRQMAHIPFDDFGDFFPDNESAVSFPTYGAYLRKDFIGHIALIRKKQLAAETDIQRVEQFVLDRLSLFDTERPVFVHTDLHMGNIMHDGNKLTAIIDFDHAMRAPAMVELTTLLGFIGLPQQFVEGRPEFPLYKGKNFFHLLPVLRSSLPELFQDPNLIKKLNLLYIAASIGMISENWSARANQALLQDLLDHEILSSDDDLKHSAYARRLRGS